MGELTLVLFERIALLLLLAFMLTRVPSFRYLLDRELNIKTIIYYSLLFSLFGIASIHLGVVLQNGELMPNLFFYKLEPNELSVSSNLVAMVIAGLFGGPYVGLSTGVIVAVYTYFLGGEMVFANSIIHPLVGLLAGWTARFFSQERVIAPTKALFIGMFAPILHMNMLLIFNANPERAIQIINTIGVPLVITNSIAIAIFTAMIRAALNEKEQQAAIETTRALKIAEEALPFLKKGFNAETAADLATLLKKELNIGAVTITDEKEVLAHNGLGQAHHGQGFVNQKGPLRALQTGEIQVAYEKEQIECQDKRCPLQAAIMIPIHRESKVIGMIYLFFTRSQQIRSVELALAQGLKKLLSQQLDVIAVEKMKALVQEAELRKLQAQINPHFLFNTLHSISSLIRINPELARHLIVQLGLFMRNNLKLTSASLIPLEQELTQLKAYLEIIKVRFSDQLTIEYNIEDEIGTTLIPPFSLQPLVENSIQHGLKDVSSGGKINICIKKNKNEILIEIIDNGKGIPSELIEKLGKQVIESKKGNGIGVFNVNQRLVTMFGDGAHLHFKHSSIGTAISFHIPAERSGLSEN